MKKILIVEDENIMRESLRDWLKEGGYEVETAAEGEKALQTISEQDFGVAILDLKLPGKSGIEILGLAREKRPQLKGIIITAYPTVQTAKEAIREGAIDYLPKPFDLNALEKLVQSVLGPVQMEMKPAAVAIAPVAPAASAVAKPVTIEPEEAPAHLSKAKVLFEARQYKDALKELEIVLGAVPGNIEARVLVQKTKEALAKPESALAAGVAGVAAETKPKECLWVRMGMVSYRICTNNYNCVSCEFDQVMQEQMAKGDSPELEAAMHKLKELPGSQRLCRYAVKGDVSYRVCSRLFQCVNCEFGQRMEDELQQKLAKLAARREALQKKDQKTAPGHN